MSQGELIPVGETIVAGTDHMQVLKVEQAADMHDAAAWEVQGMSDYAIIAVHVDFTHGKLITGMSVVFNAETL